VEPTYTKVFLKDVEVTARIGLAPWERERPQRIVASVELYARSNEYLKTITAESMIDYSLIYERVQSWRTRAHIDLVETFVSELLAACFEYPQVMACKVSVTKPEVFDQAQAAGAEVFMTRRDYELSSGMSPLDSINARESIIDPSREPASQGEA
jgi:7,8-dihydroneopterin aldolase/epimerase/oxygenase